MDCDNIIKKIFICKDKRGFEKLEGNRIRKLQNGLYPNIYNYIINRYNDSPANVTLRENLIRIIYNIEKRPVCKYCGKPAIFKGKKKSNFYTTYCSSKCAGIATFNYDSITKQRKYNLEHYGCEHNFQTTKFKEKRKESLIRKYGSVDIYHVFEDKIKNTLIRKYGSLNEFKNYSETKVKETLKERYNSLKNAYKYMHDKGDETKRKRGTFNTSKPEELGYKMLYNKFGFCNVKRQYKSKEYPFACDFYVKNINTYIEFNFFWSHGGHKYDPHNIDDLKQTEYWKEKSLTSDFYKCALHVWNVSDPLKFETAKKNNLNYLAFYTWNEFLEWYNKQ